MNASEPLKKNAVRIPIQLEKPLRQAVDVLEKNKIGYAIVGGIALAQWGAGRATMDVGFKILVPNYDYDSIRQILGTAFPKPARPHLAHEKMIMAVTVDDVIIDFLFTVEGYESLVVERAVRKNLGGWSARFSTAEDLIIQKIVAGRGKDWSDVSELLLARFEKLDFKYIKNWLSQFALVLDDRELINPFNKEYDRVKRLKKKK